LHRVVALIAVVLPGAVYARVVAARPTGSEADKARETACAAGLRERQEDEFTSVVLSTTVYSRLDCWHVADAH